MNFLTQIIHTHHKRFEYAKKSLAQELTTQSGNPSLAKKSKLCCRRRRGYVDSEKWRAESRIVGDMQVGRITRIRKSQRQTQLRRLTIGSQKLASKLTLFQWFM